MLIPVRVLYRRHVSEILTGSDWILRGNILREPFPHKDANERSPEKLDALFLHENLLSSVQRIEELHRRKEVGENDIGGVDKERTHDA